MQLTVKLTGIDRLIACWPRTGMPDVRFYAIAGDEHRTSKGGADMRTDLTCPPAAATMWPDLFPGVRRIHEELTAASAPFRALEVALTHALEPAHRLVQVAIVATEPLRAAAAAVAACHRRLERHHRGVGS